MTRRALAAFALTAAACSARPREAAPTTNLTPIAIAPPRYADVE